MNPIESKVIEINGNQIHYEKYGTGSQIVLLIPGALGTPKTDFRKQLSGDLAFDLTTYTFIGITLPGWGKSRPPKRPYSTNVYENDVTCCVKLMEILKYRNYSVIGWSDGAKVAVLTAIKAPCRVQAVVASGLFVYSTKTNLIPTVRTRQTELWDPELRNNYLDEYGKELQVLWDEHINFCKELQVKLGDLEIAQPNKKEEARLATHEALMNSLHTVRCPLLLIHGDLDPLIPLEHQFYAMDRVSNCQLKRFADASHNVHQTHTKEFADLVDRFLLDASEMF